MATLNYLNGGEAITPTAMNSLFAEFDNRLGTLLGGRSFAIAFKNGIPPVLLGKCFFFTSGLAAYATRFPSYVAQNYTVSDPILGPGQTVAGVRAYDHSKFTELAEKATVVSYDTTYRIVKVADVIQSKYPTGITKISGVGVWDHSLEAHTRKLIATGDTEERTYYLQENEASPGQGGAVFPERKHKLALAEIVIEGVARVEIPATWNKYRCFRVHNLQPTSCTVVLSGVEKVVPPYACKCYRRDEDGGNVREGRRYFFTYEDGDPRMFWYWATIPKFRSDEVAERDGTCHTATSAMQGNNLSNPAVLYDFIYYLNPSDKSGLNCWLEKDNHEWCDIYARVSAIRDYFPNPAQGGTLLGDLLFHKGKLKIVRTSKTPNPETGEKDITFDEVEFRGFATIVADFAAKSLTVAENAAGNLTIANADTLNDVDLITWTTNLLHHPEYAPGSEWVVRTGVSLQTPFEISASMFETVIGNFPNQDPDGILGFTRTTGSTYRLPVKSGSNSTSQSFDYFETPDVRKTATTDTLPGALSEAVPSLTRTLAGVHKVKVSDLLTLKYFAGNSAASNANDSFTTYTNARLLLTPSGLVCMFDEKAVDTALLSSQLTTGYKSRFGRNYEHEAGAFTAKHCVRFRKHGWGFGELGKDNAAFFPVHTGRPSVSGWQGDSKAIDGGDFSLIDQQAAVSPIRFLRQIGYNEVQAGPSSRFPSLNSLAALDGLCALASTLTAEFYRSKQTFLLNPDSSKPRLVNDGRTFAMPLSVEHYNGMAQAVNQLKNGRPLDQTALRVPYGTKVLDFGAPYANGGGLWIGAASIGKAISLTTGQPETLGPAPLDFFGSIIDTTAPGLGAWWRAWFESKGVLIRTENDLPNWTDFKDVRRESETFAERLTTRNLNVALSGNFIVGDVYASISLERTTADVDDYGYVDALPTMRRIRPADYIGVRWVSIANVKTLVESFGFPFLFVETVVPLAVGVFRLPALEDVPGVAQSSSYVATAQTLSGSLAGRTDAQKQAALLAVQNYTFSDRFALPVTSCTTGDLSASAGPSLPDLTAQALVKTAVVFYQTNQPTYKVATTVGLNGNTFYKETWREEGRPDTACAGGTAFQCTHLGLVAHAQLFLQRNGATSTMSNLNIGYQSPPNWGQDWTDVVRVISGGNYVWQLRDSLRMVKRFQKDVTNPAVDGLYAYMNRERRMLLVKVSITEGLTFTRKGLKTPAAKIELSRAFMSEDAAGFFSGMQRAVFTSGNAPIGPHTIKQSASAEITLQSGNNFFPTGNGECFKVTLDPYPRVSLS